MEPLAPFLSGLLAVLLFTAFVKIFTALSILRYGIGLTASGFGLVIVAVAMALSFVVMQPQIEKAGGLSAFMGGAGGLSPQAMESYRPFLDKHADATVLSRLQKAAGQAQATKTAVAGEPVKPVSFEVLGAAFLLSQLREAFSLGFLLLVPFLVIDLLTANALMLLGMTQISQAVVSLPLKLLLFIAVDGWTLLAEKLLAGYA